MRELLGKIGRFCENHVEKIVLAIVGIFCAWLFFTWVIFSPYVVTIDGHDYSPGQVDRYVQEQAKELEGLIGRTEQSGGPVRYVSILEGPIDPCNPVVADVFVARPKPDSFAELFTSPLAYLDPSGTMPLPDERIRDKPKYALPPVGPLLDVAVNYIRAAAYVPLSEIDATNKYDSADVEPNDIDLVTVEAKFDVADLYRQFQAYFAGTEVEKLSWRDPCLAEPVFAAVQLQRQTLLDNGSWGTWTDIPRSRIEGNRKLFSVVENVKDLPPGGLGVRLMQYDSPMITMELLQPSAYQIASADDDWFPPTFYDKYKSLQRKVDQEERRQEMEDRQQERERDTSGRTGGRTTQRGRTAGATGGRRRDAGGGGAYGGGVTGGGRTRSRGRDRTGVGGDVMGGTGRRSGRRGADAANVGMMDAYGMTGADGRMAPSTDEVYLEFAENSLTYATDMTKIDEPLLIWRFDDTAEPGHNYRYRLRLGVFNPVAGTDKVVQADAERKDQVILWSSYSDVTDTVSIPNRLYFFAKSVQDRTKTATVEVARYTLGHWRTEDFQVKLGEAIGKEMEPKDEDADRRSDRRAQNRMDPTGRNLDMMNMGTQGMAGAVGLGVDESNTLGGRRENNIPRPDIIDFRTHAILIDLVEVNDLGPQLRPRAYYDMLYSGDGVAIEHMPVSSTNWPNDLRSIYQSIKAEERKEQEPFRSFGDSGIQRVRGSGMDAMGGGLYQGMGPY